MDIRTKDIFILDGHRCVYCGTAGRKLQIDHVVPRAKGGADVVGNIASSCLPCNSSKGSKLIDRSKLPPRFHEPIDQTPVKLKKRSSRGNRKQQMQRWTEKNRKHRNEYMRIYMANRRAQQLQNQQTNHEI